MSSPSSLPQKTSSTLSTETSTERGAVSVGENQAEKSFPNDGQNYHFEEYFLEKEFVDKKVYKSEKHASETEISAENSEDEMEKEEENR